MNSVAPSSTAVSSSAPILEITRLSKAFGGVHAIDGVDLRLSEGELRCIIGPNGAGKSTLFQLIIGRVRPDGGTIRFRGRNITQLHVFQRAHLGIGIKFQNLGVYQNLTVSHNLFVPLQHHYPSPELDDAIREMLVQLKLDGSENLLVRELAHGQKQWLAIGMALAMKPTLLLLDEPTAGMSPDETRTTGEIVRTLSRRGVTILVIEHDMAFVRQLRAPITVLHFGKVFAEGTFSEIEGHAEVRRIYLGSTRR
jgi:urea transport system ATP-binding protein